MPFYWKLLKKLDICLLFIMVFPSKIFSVMFWLVQLCFYQSMVWINWYDEKILWNNVAHKWKSKWVWKSNVMCSSNEIFFYISDVSKYFWDQLPFFIIITQQYDKTMGMFHQIIPEKFSWKYLKLPSDQLLLSLTAVL